MHMHEDTHIIVQTGYTHARLKKHEFILTVLVVCFVMGCMLRFGELAHGRLLYPYYCPTVSGTSTVGPEHRLFLKLFNNYSSESRPVTNASRPVTVKFAISFNQLLDLVRLPCCCCCFSLLILLLLPLAMSSSSPRYSFFFFFLSLHLLPLFTSCSFFVFFSLHLLPIFTSCSFFVFLSLHLLPLLTSCSFFVFLFLHLLPFLHLFFLFLHLLLLFTPSFSSFLQLLLLFTTSFPLKIK